MAPENRSRIFTSEVMYVRTVDGLKYSIYGTLSVNPSVEDDDGDED